MGSLSNAGFFGLGLVPHEPYDLSQRHWEATTCFFSVIANKGFDSARVILDSATTFFMSMWLV